MHSCRSLLLCRLGHGRLAPCGCRSSTQVLALGVSESLLPAETLHRAVREALREAGIAPSASDESAESAALADSGYLSRETLELILPAEDVATGDANLPVKRGAASEAEDALDGYERAMLQELEESSLL